MKRDKQELRYRKGVVGIIVNDKDQLLIVQMVSYGEHHWRFPGGGVEEGEALDKALVRELEEELGTNKFEIVKRSKHQNKYDWPDRVVGKMTIKNGYEYIGQIQDQYLVKFVGQDSDINLKEDEIRKYKWVEVSDLEEHFVFFEQWEQTKKVLDEFQLK